MDDSLVNDIVAMLDRSVADGVGHLNVEVGEMAVDKPEQSKRFPDRKVKTQPSSDCETGNAACRIPNLDVVADNEADNGR